MMTKARLSILLFLSLFIGLPSVVSAQITVRGSLAHDLDGVPGAILTGQIVVDNDTGEPQQAKVYQTDYLFYADGSNEYDEPGTTQRSNANWIRFSPDNMVIPPNSSVTISYEVTVPDSVSNGSFWSMLMVEGVEAGSAENADETAEERQVGFRQVTRYGVQMAVHLRNQAEQNVSFDAIQLVADDEGSTHFQADVLNTGSLMMRPEVYLRIFDAEGAEHGPFEGVQFRMYPGTSVRQRIDLTSLPTGTYQALLIVDNGDDAVFGGQYELTL